MYNQQKWVKSVDSQTKRKLYTQLALLSVGMSVVLGGRWEVEGVALTADSNKVLFFVVKSC